MLKLKVLCAFCHGLKDLLIDPSVPFKDSAMYECSDCKSFVCEITEVKNKENLKELT